MRALFDDLFENCQQAPTNPFVSSWSGLTVYIAGPISGDLVGNIPAFFEAEDRLRAAGHSTFNPARADGSRTAEDAVAAALDLSDKTWADYMRQGITGLMRCTAIALLDGWGRSRGAMIEQTLAASMGYALIDPYTAQVVRQYDTHSTIPADLML